MKKFFSFFVGGFISALKPKNLFSALLLMIVVGLVVSGILWTLIWIYYGVTSFRHILLIVSLIELAFWFILFQLIVSFAAARYERFLDDLYLHMKKDNKERFSINTHDALAKARKSFGKKIPRLVERMCIHVAKEKVYAEDPIRQNIKKTLKDMRF